MKTLSNVTLQNNFSNLNGSTCGFSIPTVIESLIWSPDYQMSYKHTERQTTL